MSSHDESDSDSDLSSDNFSAAVSLTAHDQDDRENCYAFSIATAIRGALSRVCGNIDIPDHESFVERITKRQEKINLLNHKSDIRGATNSEIEELCVHYCKIFNLGVDKYSSLDDAKEFIDKGHAMVMTFSLKEREKNAKKGAIDEWDIFQTSLKNDPTSCNKRNTFQLPETRASGESSGHAVVIVDRVRENTYLIKNSWGSNLCYARMRLTEDVSKKMKIMIFHVYFKEEDLTSTQCACWRYLCNSLKKGKMWYKLSTNDRVQLSGHLIALVEQHKAIKALIKTYKK